MDSVTYRLNRIDWKTNSLNYSAANLSIQKFGATVGLGYCFNISKKLYLNFNPGFGLTSRKVRYFEIQNPKITEEAEMSEWFDVRRFLTQGVLLVFNPQARVRINWQP